MRKPEIVTALSALAQESRLDILQHLVAAGPGGRPAGQIAEVLGIPAATLSFHLKTLRQAQLIDCRRKGRLLVYRVNPAQIDALLDSLHDHCVQLAVAGRNGNGTPALRTSHG